MTNVTPSPIKSLLRPIKVLRQFPTYIYCVYFIMFIYYVYIINGVFFYTNYVKQL